MGKLAMDEDCGDKFRIEITQEVGTVLRQTNEEAKPKAVGSRSRD